MSLQQAEMFLHDLNDDDRLQNKLNDAGDINPEKKVQSKEHAEKIVNQIIAFAENQGYQFTEEEYHNALKNTDGELSEDELENIAGGNLSSYFKYQFAAFGELFS